MLELLHGMEPEILRLFKAQYSGTFSADLWSKYKEYESKNSGNKPLIRTLHALQEGLCVYCERKIYVTKSECREDELNRHVEHLLAKSTHPHLTLEYTNLALSCTCEGKRGTSTCGAKKAERLLPILPTEKHLHLFDLDMESGMLIPAFGASNDDKQKVLECISLLNLNLSELCLRRLHIIENVKKILVAESVEWPVKQRLLQDYCTERTAYGQPFAHTLRHVLSNFLH